MKQARFKLITQGLNVETLLEKLDANPELWDQETEREQYQGSPHAQAKSIILRWSEDKSPIAAYRDLACIDYPPASTLMPEASYLFTNLLDKLNLKAPEVGRVLITKLPAGGVITPHIDEGAYADHYDRFHICLRESGGNVFRCGGEEFVSKQGEAFWFNSKLEHSVQNNGASDRIHMIVDLVAPEYKALRGIYFQQEILSCLWEEVTPLLEKHYQEIAFYQDIALSPNKEAYDRAEAEGNLRVYTLRDCGKLIGYVAFIVGSLHYKDSVQAKQDVLFLLPEYRKGMAGVRLVRNAEKRLQSEGVEVIYHHAKQVNQFGALLERLGYNLVDSIYAKRLDSGD